MCFITVAIHIMQEGAQLSPQEFSWHKGSEIFKCPDITYP
jgi:hypothetical protein